MHVLLYYQKIFLLKNLDVPHLPFLRFVDIRLRQSVDHLLLLSVRQRYSHTVLHWSKKVSVAFPFSLLLFKMLAYWSSYRLPLQLCLAQKLKFHGLFLIFFYWCCVCYSSSRVFTYERHTCSYSTRHIDLLTHNI